MKREIQIFNNEEFGNVRIIGDAENPRFCLADVCKILDIGNPSQVKTRLDAGVISNEVISDSMGREQTMTFVNEDGLYDVILDSRKPEAKRFRKWITSEVLPSIRKTGLYVNPQAAISPAFLRQIADALEAANIKVKVLETQLTETKPLVDYCNVILQCAELVPTTIIAKDYGFSAKKFNKLLHELGVQFKQSGVWLPYQHYANLGWTQTKTHKYMGSDEQLHCTVHNYWTQKGRLGLYHLLKKNHRLPLIERVGLPTVEIVND